MVSVQPVGLRADDGMIQEQEQQEMKYAIAIHGGAGSSPENYSPEANESRRQSMERALEIGTEVLKNGGSALDAVEQVVVFLEDDPQFNAGRGAVFNEHGSHELDASIMDGATKDVGAVAGVSRVRNPIQLARRVMTESRHVMLGGVGAENFASRQGLIMVQPNYFDTPATLQRWMQSRQRMNGQSNNEIELKIEDTGSYYGTVGCVALDSAGNLAAATSTGGMSNKSYGRIGDSPITGAGNYADNATCAVSGTGIGEQYIRHTVCYDIAAQMQYGGKSLAEAVADNLANRLDPGDGGVIAVDRDGNIVMEFSTGGMARAAADSSGRFEVLWEEQPAGAAEGG
ncbi:MAG: isoaspartyl peptidase/L-asparaginase [Planctomycetota bacterium]